MKINLNSVTDEEVDMIANSLKAGEVIAYPTDTIYGLGCLADNETAVENIFKIKEREKDRPLLVLVSDIAMLKNYCFVNWEQSAYLSEIWPGPVTVILKNRGNLPLILTGGRDSLAVRLPKNENLVKMIKEAGKPLVSTSLNISNKEAIADPGEIRNLPFNELISLVIDAGILAPMQPSRILDIRDINNIKIIRN